jgi:hypothetical protein
MEDDLLSDLGPLVYALTKGMKAYQQALDEAASEYQKAGVDYSPIDSIAKLFSSTSEKMSQASELSVSDFLKKYQKIKTVLSLAKELLG